MKTFLYIIAISIVGFSCQKEVSQENIVATLPTLTTTAVTSITATTATSGGNITNNGGAAITARGVCWSTSLNPVMPASKMHSSFNPKQVCCSVMRKRFCRICVRR